MLLGALHFMEFIAEEWVIYVKRNGIHSCNRIPLCLRTTEEHIFIYCSKHYIGIDPSPYIYSISYTPSQAGVYKSYTPGLIHI